jgi:hypothetical protein
VPQRAGRRSGKFFLIKTQAGTASRDLLFLAPVKLTPALSDRMLGHYAFRNHSLKKNSADHNHLFQFCLHLGQDTRNGIILDGYYTS